MNTDRNIVASLTLTQTGKNGPITSALELTPKNERDLPASHEAMTQLFALYLQLQTFLQPETDENESEVYTASFVLSQDDDTGPVYSSLKLEPRIKATDSNFPSSYEVASYVATAWLQMCGVIDENGDLIDEDALEFQSIDAKERQVH